MYQKLNEEMEKKHITRNFLAQHLKMTPTTLSLKLNGKSNLTLPECISIRILVAPECSMDELFAVTEDVSSSDVTIV